MWKWQRTSSWNSLNGSLVSQRDTQTQWRTTDGTHWRFNSTKAKFIPRNPAKKKKKYPQVRKNSRVERLRGWFQLKRIAAAEAKLHGKQNKNWSRVASEPECWHWRRGCERLLARAVSGGSFIPPCRGEQGGRDGRGLDGSRRCYNGQEQKIYTAHLQPAELLHRGSLRSRDTNTGRAGSQTGREATPWLLNWLTHPFPIRGNISHKYLMYKNWPWDLFFFFW